MAFTPDLPFPKSAGDAIRSKDWNDLVKEAQRLDAAKVERAGDAITGPLSIAGALAVGKANAAAGARVDIAGGDLCINDNNVLLRAGTDPNHGLGWFGTGKLFASTNIDGPVLWGNAGGALGTGTGAGQKVALAWDNNARVAIGVPAAGFKVDIGDRIRLREGASGSAGLWLFQNTPNEDRAFVGMTGDGGVGLYGNKGIGWGLWMDVANGTTGLRASPISSYALYVNAGAAGSAAAVPWALVANGNAYTFGRHRDYKLRLNYAWSNAVNTTSTSWGDVPNMNVTITAPDIGAYFLIHVHINGVQTTGAGNVGAYFRLLVDGTQYDFTRQEFHNNGWELRGVTLGRLVFLASGSHTIAVQWYTTSATLTCCWYGDLRQIFITEL